MSRIGKDEYILLQNNNIVAINYGIFNFESVDSGVEYIKTFTVLSPKDLFVEGEYILSSSYGENITIKISDITTAGETFSDMRRVRFIKFIII